MVEDNGFGRRKVQGVRVSAPLRFRNWERCVSINAEGATLNQNAHTVDVWVRTPAGPPLKVDIDLAGKGVGWVLRARDLELPRGVVPVKPDFVLAKLKGARVYTGFGNQKE